MNDLLCLIDTIQNDGGSTAGTNVQQDEPSAASAGQKRDKHDDEDDEEEDDDDRNFKRRNVSTTTPATEGALPTSPRTGDKRTYSAEGDDRPSKQVRGDEQSQLSGLPSHLRQRLGQSSSGGEQRRRAPCRNFEGKDWIFICNMGFSCIFYLFYIERGYCVYGDSCKFDHGEEQITVNDYSKFQAIMGSSGAMGMTNPMMMQNPGNSIGKMISKGQE